ncbi:PREDICTED: uncharacterized protein LOC109171159 [Ipomoea nil]|uniref:uncharacterized protein LOC109171159 n=1 Tax=Ipomoea nil TaxID=35883 RepID=UPI0009014550|nr:PREDICTED: uncharacterized protein LOC109171159 [Ipomoea nil]
MSTLSWNCRGLGNPRTVREIEDIVSRKKPDFVFLMETKFNRDHAERLRVKLGFEGLFNVDNSGLSGGMAMLWRANSMANLIGYSNNYIDIEVTIPGFDKWRMTGFYGFPKRPQRRESWDLIRSLAGKSELPWVIIGDFNDLLYQYEKRGGNPHPDSLLRGFGETIEECGLTQLPMSGYPYTWEKRKGTLNWIEERLDKVLATQSWRELGCREVVEKSWGEGRDRGLQECTAFCGTRLTRWGGDRFHKFGEKIAALRKEQMRLRGRTDSVSLTEFRRLDACLTRIELQEDVYWRQRAKQHWLKDADANTKFYHSTPMIDEDFFGGIQPRITTTQNEKLVRPFEVEEIKAALFSIHPDKAPGPDGMNPGFYQNFWDVVGSDVATFIRNSLNNCSLPDGLNETNIILIPKKKTPEMVSDYRPIALSNVVYRVMAKVITARMKPVMDSIISESQSAFISERLITDNILVAAEVGHYLNRKQYGLAGWGALKLDMAKAYDRMEWSFLQRMLEALGFDGRWVKLLMMCVSTVSYSVLINGSKTEQITPTRGLRQGDPLSPYLFIICAEGLSILLKQAEVKGDIHGCRVARAAPSITHLFFAGDSLLFFKANNQEAGAIKRCLTTYETMSGQAVNYHKSNICFSKNTSEEVREEIADILGVVQAQNFGKYLGLPFFVGRNRRQAFSYIEDKIKQGIGSWNKKLLSQAGKEVLLKSVAQAMPTFAMSIFLLPMNLCTAIERAMNRFWWRSGNEQGIHWKAWDKMCIPKTFGGLGFKELRAFNLAMLGKQAWRFLTQPQSLVSRVYKARYYPTSSFYEAALGNNPSFCWRSILAAKGLICGGVRRRIGNGKSTLIWDHPWIHDDNQPRILTEKPPQLAQAKVEGLIDQQTGTWDHEILADIFIAQDVEKILKIPVSLEYEDMWYWYGDPKGEYSVKEGYKVVRGNYSQPEGNFHKWKKLWSLKAPPKWKTFLWRALNDILPTMENLLIKRVDIDPTCAMCGVGHENLVHSLITCDDDGIIYAVALLYFIWRTRNGAVWEAKLPRPQNVIAMALSSVNAWKEAHPARRSPQAITTIPAAILPPVAAVYCPREGAAIMGEGEAETLPLSREFSATVQHNTTQNGRNQCYFDATYDPTTNKAAMGAIILDS